MHYQNTQRGYLLIAILGVVLLIIAILTIQYPQLIIILGLMILVFATFSSLKTTVDNNYLTITFGIGLIKKKFPLEKIDSVLVVKNRWYYGWGIHFWLFPRMWVFNVSGFDAIEIQTKNKKLYRIGTNNPQELKEAIDTAKQTHKYI